MNRVSQPVAIALAEFRILRQPGVPAYDTTFVEFNDAYLAVAAPVEISTQVFDQLMNLPSETISGRTFDLIDFRAACGIPDSVIVWIQRIPVREGIPISMARVYEANSFSVAKTADVHAGQPEVGTPTLTQAPPKKTRP